MAQQTLTRPAAQTGAAPEARRGRTTLQRVVRVAVPVVAVGALVAVPAWVATTRSSGKAPAPARVAITGGLNDYRAGERAGAAQLPAATDRQRYREGERS